MGYEPARGHEIEFLGMIAENEFRLDPSSSRKTFFGTLSQNEALAPSNLQSLWIRFDGDNRGNRRVFNPHSWAYASLTGFRVGLRAEHDFSRFTSTETESLDLSGTARLISG